jgi:hypothetical protein
MADEKYCKNCGAPLSKEGEPVPSEPKGYFPLLRQSGPPSPQTPCLPQPLQPLQPQE